MIKLDVLGKPLQASLMFDRKESFLTSNIRLGWRGLPRTKALAYLVSSSLIKRPNKLECLFTASLNSQVYYLLVRQDPTLIKNLRFTPLGLALALPVNIRLG